MISVDKFFSANRKQISEREFLCVLNAIRAFSMISVDKFFGANGKQISLVGP